MSWHWKLMQNLSDGWLVTWKLTRNVVNFDASSWKSENLHLMGSFCQKHVSFRWKSTEELSLMTRESDAKFEKKLAHGLKNGMTNLVNFNVSSGISENLHFDVLLLSIAYKVSAKKVQKSYLSWHWRVIQTLNKNSFFVWKMTWEIWWILTRAVENLKICTLMGYFCQKYVMFELK